MFNIDLEADYFGWLCDQVAAKNGPDVDIIDSLYHIQFVWHNQMDMNRYSDGQFLIYRFADENGYSRELISDYFEPKECSVLEMMVALALRCEDTFTYDVTYGDRTNIWFWEMVNSLGLFETDSIEKSMERFMDLEYEPNGKGGLFTIPNCVYDLREIDIWTQLCWWLDYKGI